MAPPSRTVRRRPVNLDQFAPLTDFVTPANMATDASRLERIETLLAAVLTECESLRTESESLRTRQYALEKERDEVKSRLRGAVWAFNFVIGTLVIGALSLAGQLKDLFPK